MTLKCVRDDLEKDINDLENGHKFENNFWNDSVYRRFSNIWKIKENLVVLGNEE